MHLCSHVCLHICGYINIHISVDSVWSQNQGTWGALRRWKWCLFISYEWRNIPQAGQCFAQLIHIELILRKIVLFLFCLKSMLYLLAKDLLLPCLYAPARHFQLEPKLLDFKSHSDSAPISCPLTLCWLNNQCALSHPATSEVPTFLIAPYHTETPLPFRSPYAPNARHQGNSKTGSPLRSITLRTAVPQSKNSGNLRGHSFYLWPSNSGHHPGLLSM